jgi:hypothetical protein
MNPATMEQARAVGRVNGVDLLGFLAGDDPFYNLASLWAAAGKPAQKTPDQYLAGPEGRQFLTTTARYGCRQPEDLYVRREDGWWAHHKVAMDYAGSISADFRLIVYHIVADAASKLRAARAGGNGVAPETGGDHTLAMLDALRQEIVSRKQLESRVESVEAKADTAETMSRMAHESCVGLHGWYTLAPWASKIAGIFLSEQEAAWEAVHFVIPLCHRRGFTPRKEGYSVKYVRVNAYPESVLWEWAEDYAQRHHGCGFRGRPRQR